MVLNLESMADVTRNFFLEKMYISEVIQETNFVLTLPHLQIILLKCFACPK